MIRSTNKWVFLALGLMGCSLKSSENPNHRAGAKPKPSPQSTNSEDGNSSSDQSDQEDSSNSFGLSKGQNFTMTLAQNNSQSLKDYFGKAEYILLDFSQYGCGYCHSQAEEFQKNAMYQKIFSSSKCKLLVTLPLGDLEAWINRYKASSTVGEGSCEVEDQFEIARAFNFELTGTPTTILIDRNGKVIVEDNAFDLEEKLQELCL